MTDDLDRHRRVRALLAQVREEPPDRRDAALAAACAGDSGLYAEVAGLLSAADRADSFLEPPAAARPGESRRLVGRRFGPYDVRSVIGVGGMGEVYRARDTKLDREVALKVLPEIFAADPDRRARFDREARVLASLNHPHIGAIYGIEESDGIRALVLELVEGPTLADRIAEGAIPLDEALAIARQVARALVAAHGQGIVHRDLKPANVKLRTDGTVKVLDFGLATTVTSLSDGTSPPDEHARTETRITHLGLILGTTAYMSPEQAKGRAADRRSDIWAFGCVLFEMLTARSAFEGGDVSETLALVLTREPDWRLLPPRTPPSVRRLLRRSLEKDRERRLADIADAQLELDEPVPEPGDAGPAPPADARARRPSWLPWSVAAASLLVALWLGADLAVGRREIDTAVYRSSILLPARVATQFGHRSATLALSPDGRRLAFVATGPSGQAQLWLRALDSDPARPLADTEGATSPFWSPDGRWLAFVAGGALRKVDPSGGPVVTICGSAWAGGAWSADDVILFTHSGGYSLARVRASGGEPVPATTIDFKAGQWGHLGPVFLPDGRHFLYSAFSGSGQPLGLYSASLDSASPARLPVDASFVQYARGFLWFGRGTTLMAQPFDPERQKVRAEAVSIAEQLRAAAGYGTFFSVSATGVLVFQTDVSPGYELTWFDRSGRPTGTLGTRADYADLALSPDARRAVVSIGEPGTDNRDLWVFDVARGVRTRLTFDPVPQTHCTWSPDGTRIAFDTSRPGHFGLYQRRSDGVGDLEVLLEDGFDDNPTAWSPDGRSLLYIKRSDGTANLWVLPLAGERKPFAFTHTEFNVPAQFSPDGRWVVYGSADSGRVEVYVAPFPGPGARSLVSSGWGMDPRWRRDGKEILYLDPSKRTLMSAAVEAGRDRVEIGAVTPLFELPKVGPRYTYDISPDGQRILAVTRKDDAGPAHLALVVNWPALLKE